MTIKAIETRYKGYRFRSRLEARWAVFFDAFPLRWEYEHEGYDLGKEGYYLPDFYLPDLEGGTFVEVKPDDDQLDKYEEKFLTLTKQTGKHLLLAVGVPERRSYLFFTPQNFSKEECMKSVFRRNTFRRACTMGRQGCSCIQEI
jgi:hypothetical protein